MPQTPLASRAVTSLILLVACAALDSDVRIPDGHLHHCSTSVTPPAKPPVRAAAGLRAPTFGMAFPSRVMLRALPVSCSAVSGLGVQHLKLRLGVPTFTTDSPSRVMSRSLPMSGSAASACIQRLGDAAPSGASASCTVPFSAGTRSTGSGHPPLVQLLPLLQLSCRRWQHGKVCASWTLAVSSAASVSSQSATL